MIAILKDLILTKNKKEILNIKELKIPENKIVSIVGPSGAGKTSLLNLIAKLDKPTSGELNVLGDLKTHEMGYILQDNLIYEETTVSNNIYLSAKNSFKWRKQARGQTLSNFIATNNISNKWIDKKLNEYLNNEKENKEAILFANLFSLVLFVSLKNKVAMQFIKTIRLKNIFQKDLNNIANKMQISDILNNKAKNISGGQKQRVLIAKAIIKKANLILMDEPFSALDIKIKEKAIDWIIKIKNDFNLSIILITHDQYDALKLSDYILVLNSGKLEQFDTKENILNKPKNYFVANFFSNPSLNFWNKNDSYIEYLRPIDVKLNSSDIVQEYKVVAKENLGNLILYTVKNHEGKIIKSLSIDSQLNIGDYVTLNVENEKILRFENEQN